MLLSLAAKEQEYLYYVIWAFLQTSYADRRSGYSTVPISGSLLMPEQQHHQLVKSLLYRLVVARIFLQKSQNSPEEDI